MIHFVDYGCSVLLAYASVRNFLVFRYHDRLLEEVSAIASKVIDQHYQLQIARLERGRWKSQPYPDWRDLFRLMPEYRSMMLRFWVWPLSRFGTIETIHSQFKAKNKNCIEPPVTYGGEV